ncbi:uncharacterized protein LOC127173104 [Labeo rohita]|uniref:uncharacterized protein LOC127173104 n=1 Tax=Labeo rohita TaxID=84645 RepID=UPI0021E2F9E2|nr:uncharacterized protein LOC127173104 [Labeo rohita]
MSTLQLLSDFLTERLTLAAQEIFKAVEDIFSEYNEEICRSRQEIELLKRRLQQAGVQMDSETQPCSSETQGQKHTQTSSEELRSEHDLKDTEMHMILEVYTKQENEEQMPVYSESASLSPCMDIYHDQTPSKDTEPQMMDRSENNFTFINQGPKIKTEFESNSETGTTCQVQQHITKHGLDDSGGSDASSDSNTINVRHIGSTRHEIQTFNLQLRNQEMLMQHRMELAQIRQRMSLTIQPCNSERQSKESQSSVYQDEVSKYDERKPDNARYSQAWRDRLKKDPVKFADFKALEAARAREYRRKRTATATEIDKGNNRERQRRFRAKKKLQKCEDPDKPPSPKKNKVLTEEERMKKREYNRIRKREERERMGAEKKRQIREIDASRKREKRKMKKQTDTPHTNVGFLNSTAGSE